MMIFLVSIQFNTYVEKFVPNILSKEKITNKKRWFQEEVLMEEPDSIQHRTDSPSILIDEVTGEPNRWFVEKSLGESPIAIQERPVGSLYAQDSTNSEQETSVSHASHK